MSRTSARVSPRRWKKPSTYSSTRASRALFISPKPLSGGACEGAVEVDGLKPRGPVSKRLAVRLRRLAPGAPHRPRGGVELQPALPRATLALLAVGVHRVLLIARVAQRLGVSLYQLGHRLPLKTVLFRRARRGCSGRPWRCRGRRG